MPNKISPSTSKFQETLLASIVNNSSDAIISKDLNGTIMSWNKGAELMYGYTAKEIIGKSIHLIIPDSKKSELQNILQQIAQGQAITHFETIRRTKKGKLIYVSLTVSPIKQGSDIIGASTIARDITSEKTKQEEIEQLNKIMLGRELKMIELKAEIEKLKQHEI